MVIQVRGIVFIPNDINTHFPCRRMFVCFLAWEAECECTKSLLGGREPVVPRLLARAKHAGTKLN